MKKIVSIAVCVFLLLVGCSTTSAQLKRQSEQAQVSDAKPAIVDSAKNEGALER